jgi:hypothetical protein
MTADATNGTVLLNAHGVGGANATLLLKAPRTSRLRPHQNKFNLMNLHHLKHS